MSVGTDHGMVREKTWIKSPSLLEEGEGGGQSDMGHPPLLHRRGPPHHHQSLPAYVTRKCNEKYLINAHFYLCRGNKVGMEIYFYCIAMVAVVEMASEAVVALCGNRPGWRRQGDKVAVVAARQWWW